MSGPPPKRDAERRRRNKKPVDTVSVDVEKLITAPVEVPEVDEGWHPIAQRWYLSLQQSGQAIFYEPSDWATAHILAEALHRELAPQPVITRSDDGEIDVQMITMPIKGASLNSILKGMTALMVTEGDRRRLSIELERKRASDEASAVAAGAASISQQRQKRLGG